MQILTPDFWQRPRPSLRAGLLFACMVCLSLAAFPTKAASSEDTVISVEPAALLSPAELRELVAPIALYSDELLAIVLPASTYPLQIVAAARYREAVIEDPSLEPDEYWDESIVALLNYPEALEFLNSDLDWTWELGQAVTDQQAELLNAVSAYRDEAYAAGNLESDDKHVVAVEDDVVTIKSADPEVIHVPYYDPEEVTIYQTERVYHYYPSAYPVYYYPYSSWHRFYDDRFWGVNSAFVLSWSGFYLGHHLHSHHYHPYFGRRYHRNHYRFTHRYNSPHAYKKRHKHRKEHRDQRPRHRREHDRWQPNRRWMGDRPNRAERRIAGHHPRERHLRRNPQRQLNKGEARQGGRHFRTERQRSSAHRIPRREVNSLAQNGNRSSVHRPTPNERDKRFQSRQTPAKKLPRQRDAAHRQHRTRQGGERSSKMRVRNHGDVAQVQTQRPQRQVQRQARTQPRANQVQRAQRQAANTKHQNTVKQFNKLREQRQQARAQQQRPQRAAKLPRAQNRAQQRTQPQRRAHFARQ